MPERLQPLDYEGVFLSSRSKSWSDDPDAMFANVDDWHSPEKDDAGDPAFSSGREPQRSLLTPQNENAGASSAPVVLGHDNVERKAPSKVARVFELARGQHAIITRGHALSFLGLFLFTADVYLRPYELFPALSFLNTSAFWIAVFTLLVYVPTQLGMEGKLTIKPREVKLALLLLLAGLLSVPLALEPLKAWKGFLEYTKVVLMFIVMINVLRTEKRLRWLLLLVLFASCVLSASALYDYISGNIVLKGRIQGVIGGLFENPNDLALHLVTMVPVAVALSFGSRGLLKKASYVAVAVLSVAGVIVTFSRGGFLGLVCVAGILAWELSRRARLLVGLLTPVFLVSLLLLAPGGYRNRLSTKTDESAESAAARWDDLKRSLFIAARHPVFGVGIDNYVLFSNLNKATHNAYTQVAAEMGFPALTIYVMFLVTPLKQSRKLGREMAGSRRTSRFFYLAVGLEASLVGYVVTSFFASVAYLWYAYYLVAYIICLRRLHTEDSAKARSNAASGDAAHGKCT